MNITTLKLQHMGNKATSTSSEAQSLPVQCKAETNTALIHNKQNHWQNPFFVNHLSFCQKHHLNLMLLIWVAISITDQSLQSACTAVQPVQWHGSFPGQKTHRHNNRNDQSSSSHCCAHPTSPVEKNKNYPNHYSPLIKKTIIYIFLKTIHHHHNLFPLSQNFHIMHTQNRSTALFWQREQIKWQWIWWSEPKFVNKWDTDCSRRWG